MIALGLPLGTVFDRLWPSASALEQLAHYSRGARLCVGYGVMYTAHRVDGALVGTWYRQQLFIFLPDVFRNPTVIEITKDQAGNVTSEQSPHLLVFVGAMYVASIWGAWSLRRSGAAGPISGPRPAPPARTA